MGKAAFVPGGLGACPCAPGTSGNVVTEDLVFMFEAMELCTGVNIGRLLAAREQLRAGWSGAAICDMTPEAGLLGMFVRGFAGV